MKNNFSWRERFQYKIDHLFSRGGTVWKILLALLSIGLIVLVFAAFLAIYGAGIEWEAARYFLNGKQGMNGAAEGETANRFVSFLLILLMGGCIVFLSTLIGFLSNSIERKIDQVKKGRSKVIESGHTVILGWSKQIFAIVSELVIANKNRKNSCIVILGDYEKERMEEEIHAIVGDTGNTRIICRTGIPAKVEDLSIVSLNTAKSIIVLATSEEDPDSSTIKTVLAITHHPQRREELYHIIAEIRDPHDFEIARIIGKEEVEWIFTGGTVARIIAQTCRQSGLSVVYVDLLDFDGDEIYLYQNENLDGHPFCEVMDYFKKNAVLGLVSSSGDVRLNPAMHTVLQQGDKLVLLSEDDESIFMNCSEKPTIQQDAIVGNIERPVMPEQVLILGWNWRAPAIIRQMDLNIPDGSSVRIVAEINDLEDIVRWECPDLTRIQVNTRYGETTDRRLLNSLDLGNVDHVIVLSSDDVTRQKADSLTLMTLLHLRDISEKQGYSFSIVTEMKDVRNRKLATITRADDFIVSDRLVSLMMAQVSENKKINPIFSDIFSAEGADISLKPADLYIQTEVPINFYTVVESARQRGELAIGYKLHEFAQSPEKSFGVVLNPDKTEKISFTNADQLIVMASR